MDGRDRAVRRILLSILVLNAAVATAKLIYGFVSGSISISADAVHSYADGASNVVALIALSLAAQPPDREHPYGHRKFEVLGSMAIGIMIILGMLGVASRTFVADRPPPSIGPGGFTVVLGTLAINIAVAIYESRAGRRLGSELLRADSRHTASDVLATTAVLIAFTAETLGWQGADQAAAIFIMVLIGLVSWDIFRTSIGSLVDAAPLDRDALARVILDVPGVVDCHKIRSRGAAGDVHVDLHIQVSPTITVAEGHDIAHHVQAALKATFPSVVEAVVHTEPASPTQLETDRVSDERASAPKP